MGAVCYAIRFSVTAGTTLYQIKITFVDTINSNVNITKLFLAHFSIQEAVSQKYEADLTVEGCTYGQS